MTLGIVLPETSDTNPLEFAIQAEKNGFDSVWIGELWGESVFTTLTEIATETNNIGLGTGIVNVYSRSPAVLAMSAKSLDRISNGRAVVGVGVSTPDAIENLHSMSYESPVLRTKEAIELIKECLHGQGDHIEYEGDVFAVDGSQSSFKPLDATVPIYNAALGEYNRYITGVCADGWLPNNIPLSALEDSFEEIKNGAKSAGREPAEIDVLPWIHTVISDDMDTAEAAIRDRIAYYVGSAPGYKRAVGTHFGNEVKAIASAWRSTEYTEARELVTPEMLNELGIFGTADEVHSQIEKVQELSIVDTPILCIPPNVEDELIEATFDQLNPNALST
jgi:alkanesulfonate monooxygenase SsuD/methylene tetrahydromethanopterin reductase-like flavin-dependent oxidoreductase (luciferase family)